MDDPQKPRYDKPYCWKCMGHTKFRVFSVDFKTDSGGLDKRVIITCRGCGKKMKEPRKYDFSYYGPQGVVCLLFSCLLAIGCFLLIGTVTVVLLIWPVVLGIMAARKYVVWKKWAKERGWEGK